MHKSRIDDLRWIQSDKATDKRSDRPSNKYISQSNKIKSYFNNVKKELNRTYFGNNKNENKTYMIIFMKQSTRREQKQIKP